MVYDRMKKSFVLALIVVSVVGMGYLIATVNDSDTENNKQQKSTILNHDGIGIITSQYFEPPKLPIPSVVNEMNGDKNDADRRKDLPDSVRQSIENDFASGSEFNVSLGEDAGFDREGAERLASNDPNALLSVDNLPEELGDFVKQQISDRKEKGYDDIGSSEADDIINVSNYIVGNTYPIARLSFDPSKLPDGLTASYGYLGHTFPNIYTNPDGIHDTLRRVYKKYSSNEILIIEETTLKRGGTTLIAEFVNAQVSTYPAIYAVKRTELDQSYKTLNWTLYDFSYVLYQVGENSSSPLAYLVAIAELITALNDKKTASNRNNDEGGGNPPTPPPP